MCIRHKNCCQMEITYNISYTIDFPFIDKGASKPTIFLEWREQYFDEPNAILHCSRLRAARCLFYEGKA